MPHSPTQGRVPFAPQSDLESTSQKAREYPTKWLKRGQEYGNNGTTELSHALHTTKTVFSGCLEENLSLKQKQQLQKQRKPLEQGKVVAPQRPLATSCSYHEPPFSVFELRTNPLIVHFAKDFWKQSRSNQGVETFSCACAANFCSFFKEIFWKTTGWSITYA